MEFVSCEDPLSKILWALQRSVGGGLLKYCYSLLHVIINSKIQISKEHVSGGWVGWWVEGLTEGWEGSGQSCQPQLRRAADLVGTYKCPECQLVPLDKLSMSWFSERRIKLSGRLLGNLWVDSGYLIGWFLLQSGKTMPLGHQVGGTPCNVLRLVYYLWWCLGMQ